jgi:hypothetical protein
MNQITILCFVAWVRKCAVAFMLHISAEIWRVKRALRALVLTVRLLVNRTLTLPTERLMLNERFLVIRTGGGNLYVAAGDPPLSGPYTQDRDVPIGGNGHRPEELHLQGLRDPVLRRDAHRRRYRSPHHVGRPARQEGQVGAIGQRRERS